MPKKLNWVFRIIPWMLGIFIFTNILVKAIIWSSASKTSQLGNNFEIIILRGAIHTEPRYTNELQQQIFYRIDYLLTPVLFVSFAMLARRLIKTSDIFELKEVK